MGLRPGGMTPPPPPPPSAPPRPAVAIVQTERTPPLRVARWPTPRSGSPPPPPARGGGRYYLRPAKRLFKWFKLILFISLSFCLKYLFIEMYMWIYWVLKVFFLNYDPVCVCVSPIWILTNLNIHVSMYFSYLLEQGLNECKRRYWP